MKSTIESIPNGTQQLRLIQTGQQTFQCPLIYSFYLSLARLALFIFPLPAPLFHSLTHTSLLFIILSFLRTRSHMAVSYDAVFIRCGWIKMKNNPMHTKSAWNQHIKSEVDFKAISSSTVQLVEQTNKKTSNTCEKNCIRAHNIKCVNVHMSKARRRQEKQMSLKKNALWIFQAEI